MAVYGDYRKCEKHFAHEKKKEVVPVILISAKWADANLRFKGNLPTFVPTYIYDVINSTENFITTSTLHISVEGIYLPTYLSLSYVE